MRLRDRATALGLLVLAICSFEAASAQSDWTWRDSGGNQKTSEDFAKILDEHRVWVTSAGQQGSRALLIGSDLSGADLTGAMLRQAVLSGANLSGADLSGADLREADLVGANLSHCKLIGAQFHETRLVDVKLESADFSSAHISKTTIQRAVGDSVSFKYVVFSFARIADSELTNALFLEASGSCDIEDSDLTDARFIEADIGNWKIATVILSRADFTRTDMTGMRLTNLDLSTCLGLETAEIGWARQTDVRWPDDMTPPSVDSPWSRPVDRSWLESILLNYPLNLMILLAVLLPLVWLTMRSLESFRSEREVKKTKELIRSLEKEEKPEEEFDDFVDRILRAASERERLSMISADRRSVALFQIGTSLMTLSVVAPLAAFVVYFLLDPMSVLLEVSSVEKLAEAGLDSLPSRDWHVLAAGLSFGLLFLAAARGILTQEAKQRSASAESRRRTTQFVNMVSALRIAKRNAASRGPASAKSVIGRIVEQLSEPPQRTPEDGSQNSEPRKTGDSAPKENSIPSQLVDQIRALIDSSARQ